MVMLEMPIKELALYQGSTPCPPDFDAYWDTALHEMRDIDPQIKLVPAAVSFANADCFDLYFTGVGQSRIHAMFLLPKKRQGKVPAVVQFHGYSDSSGDWSEKLGLVNSGFAVACMDCRGQGGSSEDLTPVRGTTFHGHIVRGLDDAPEKLRYREIFLDAAQLAGIVMEMEEVDASRVGAMGASQGGALTVACAALEPRIRRAAPVYPFLSDYKRVWEMGLAQNAYQELSQYFRYHDPQHLREEEIFTRLGYIDIQNLARRVEAKVLWGIGMADTICPPSSQFAAYNKLCCEKEMKIYPDFAHEKLPGLMDEVQMFMEQL